MLPQAGDRAKNPAWFREAVGALGHVFRNPQSILCGVIAGLLFIPTTIFDMVWGVRYLQEAHGLRLRRGRDALGDASLSAGSSAARSWASSPTASAGASRSSSARALVLLACLAWILYGPADVLPPYVLGLVAGVASGAAMLPYTVIKEANPPTGERHIHRRHQFHQLHLQRAAGPRLRPPPSAWVEAERRMRIWRLPGHFQPLLYGVGLAIVLTLLLKETGPAARRPAPRPRRLTMTQTWNRQVRTAAGALPGPRPDPDGGRLALRGDGAGRRDRCRARGPDHADPGRARGDHRASSPRPRASTSAAPRSWMSPTATPPPRGRWRWCARARPSSLMKGSLHSDEILAAVIAKETGLRTGRRLSHVFLMDVPTYHKVLIVTDARDQHRADARGQGGHLSRTRSTWRGRSAWSGRRWRSSPRSRR